MEHALLEALLHPRNLVTAPKGTTRALIRRRLARGLPSGSAELTDAGMTAARELDRRRRNLEDSGYTPAMETALIAAYTHRYHHVTCDAATDSLLSAQHLISHPASNQPVLTYTGAAVARVLYAQQRARQRASSGAAPRTLNRDRRTHHAHPEEHGHGHRV